MVKICPADTAKITNIYYVKGAYQIYRYVPNGVGENNGVEL
jgi:hypothetical protein